MWSYFHTVITAYMYKDIKAYLYVNMRMCWCVNMLICQQINMCTQKRTNTYMGVRSQHIRCDTIFTEFRGWKLIVSEGFVWRTHILLLDPRDSHVASFLRMTMVTHLHFYICVYYHIYALPLMAITTTPYYH